MAFGVEGGQITKLPLTRNPDDIYSGGINRGLDVAVPRGTPVKLPPGKWQVVHAFSGATAEGPNNSQRSLNQGYGNRVVVKNMETGELISFAHLSQVNVKNGEVLDGGLVGYSGATGNVTGESGFHLDIEYYDQTGKLRDITKTNYWDQPTPQESRADVLGDRTSLMDRIVRPAMAAEEDFRTTVVPTPGTAARTPTLPGAAAHQIQPLSPRLSPFGTQDTSKPVRLIQSGESLSKIARDYNTNWQEIAKLNPQIKDPNKIYAGDLLYVPASRLFPTEEKKPASPFTAPKTFESKGPFKLV